MKSDGQLYERLHKGEKPPLPPPCGPEPQICEPSPPKLKKTNEEILLLGIIFLLLTEKTEKNFPLLLALVYVFFSK